MTHRPIPRWIWWLGLAAAVWRVAYVLAQPATDPTLARPALDGAYYVGWAQALAFGGSAPEGAFYLAPLYPHLLAAVFRTFGDGLFLPLLLQQLALVAAAVALALFGRRQLGSGAPLAAVLFLLYQPLAFFASRPLGESLAVTLLLLALLAAWRDTGRTALAAGVLLGLSVLVRPNLLLVAPFWTVALLRRGSYRRVALLLGGLALVVLPVTLRNLRASGHAVLVSSNAGLTFYHGNGPGAAGTYTAPEGFSGGVLDQRREAIELAQQESGRALDAVEADRWWGRKALRVRARDPLGSAVLVLRRAMLLLDSREIGLDYAPALDTNPLRLSWRVPRDRDLPLIPFGLLLALAVLGLTGRGMKRSGGWQTWTALAACAATPLLFYVASRYRLPLAALMSVPAGSGLAHLLRLEPREDHRPAGRALGLAGAALLWSLGGYCLVSGTECRAWSTSGLAQGLSMRSLAYRDAGDLAAAIRDGERATRLAPRSALVRYNLGVVQRAAGQRSQAEASFLAAQELDPPGRAAAAGDLAQMWVAAGRADEAVPILRRALAESPAHDHCWRNLVAALVVLQRYDEAREALDQARAQGIRVHPELESLVRSRTAPGETSAGGATP